MTRRWRHWLTPAVFTALALLGVWVGSHIYNLNITNGTFPFGLVVAVIGAVMAAWLLAVSAMLVVKNHRLMSLNQYVIMASLFAAVLILFEAAAYISLLVIIMTVNSITF